MWSRNRRARNLVSFRKKEEPTKNEKKKHIFEKNSKIATEDKLNLSDVRITAIIWYLLHFLQLFCVCFRNLEKVVKTMLIRFLQFHLDEKLLAKGEQKLQQEFFYSLAL